MVEHPPQIFISQDGRWFIGIELKTANAPNSATLREKTAHPDRSQMWVGYEGEDSENYTNLAVYVYCADSSSQQCIEVLVRSRLKSARVKSEDRDKKYFNVTVKTHCHLLPSDADWFCSVFDALSLRLVP